MSLKVKLFILVLASMLSTADLLRCYSCRGEKCTSAPQTCPEGGNYCFTLVNPDQAYKETKGCESSPTLANCGEHFRTGSQEVYCCNTDLCNGAGTIEKSLLLLLVPLASIFVLS